MGVPSYDDVGVTEPAIETWAGGLHRFEATVRLGNGEACWSKCREDVLTWAVKTRSGFSITGGPSRVQVDADCELIFKVGPLTVHEPVTVVAVVDEPDRCGFAYGTRPGHPVAGEEAFIVTRDNEAGVHLTIRSLTLPAPGWRRAAYPAFRAAQWLLRRRYLTALGC